MDKHIQRLQTLAKAKPHVCCYHIIESADNKFVNLLCQRARQILEGDIFVTLKQYSNLKPYKDQLETLSRKKTSKKRRKQVLQGGFLPALIVPILASLLL